MRQDAPVTARTVDIQDYGVDPASTVATNSEWIVLLAWPLPHIDSQSESLIEPDLARW